MHYLSDCQVLIPLDQSTKIAHKVLTTSNPYKHRVTLYGLVNASLVADECVIVVLRHS